MKLNCLPAHLIAEKIKSGEITAESVANDCIERIKERNPEVKAFISFDEDNFLSMAREIDEQLLQGKEPGNLCGVPVGIKDVFNTIEFPTQMGSPIWDGFTPGNDARVVSYFKWADAVIAGKTATAEFAVHHPAETVNPCNSKYSPGTSSSGSAAAVADEMIPIAIGSQTAGSTIRPASYCGIFGYKPSFGLIPRTGVLKTLDTLDHITIFSRDVEDLLLTIRSIRLTGPNYPYIHETLDQDEKKISLKKNEWKVAFVKTPVWDHAESYAQNDIIAFAEKLSGVDNVYVNEIELPDDFNRAHAIHDTIYTKALSYYFRGEYEKDKEKISEVFCRMVERGNDISVAEYHEGLRAQQGLIARLDSFFQDFDIILTLSTTGSAPLLYGDDKIDSCLIWTLCHVPSMNLPIFKSPEGMPFGAQIIGSKYKDYDLIKFAKYLKDKDQLTLWNEKK